MSCGLARKNLNKRGLSSKRDISFFVAVVGKTVWKIVRLFCCAEFKSTGSVERFDTSSEE